METENKTQKCKQCQSDIPLGAKKCPHCQSDLRSWFKRHPILTGLVVLVIFIIIISTLNTDSEKIGEVDRETSTEEATKYEIGDQIELGSAIITVNDIEFSEGGTFTSPSEGNKWVNLNITIENTGSRDHYITTLGQMFIRDNEGYSYQVAVTDKTLEGAGTHGLDGNILAESKRTGWVGFEIRDESEGLEFQYNASMFGGSNVRIDLGQ